MTDDLISRQAAIDALRKALNAYEDKTEKQFKGSDELDVSDWIVHRIFVQNMNVIDRETILALPSAQPDGKIMLDKEAICNKGESTMMDLIERQAAIDAVESAKTARTPDGEIYVAKLNAEMNIRILPSAQPERWIPVTEGLPEEKKQVLVCDDGGFIYTAEGETRSDGEWQWYESAEYRPMEDVVAWMPLPDPWKGEEDDTERPGA